MIKFTRYFLSFFFFTLLLSGCNNHVLALPEIVTELSLKNSLVSLPNIVSVDSIDKGRYVKKYVVKISQPLAHNDLSKGSFSQRVIVCHRGYDRPTLFVTEGYDCNYALSTRYVEELSDLLHTNIVVVEHRYFDESTPAPNDWKWLNVENSMGDLHNVRQTFKTIYQGKWISTGTSKGGSTTIMYRTYFSDDVDMSVAYVGPVAFGVEDGRHEPFIDRCGTDQDRRIIRDFQIEVLKRRDKFMSNYERYCNDRGYKFRVSLNEIYDLCVLEYSFAHWQTGVKIEGVPSVTASDKDMFAYFVRTIDPLYFSIGNVPAYFVQASHELGYYGYDTRPFEKYLFTKDVSGYLNRVLLPQDAPLKKFDTRVAEDIKAYMKNNDPKMIFIYGEFDPWSAVALEDKYFEGKQNMKKYVEPAGSHFVRITTMSENLQADIMTTLKKWLNE